jgi:hypothetical protein
MIVDEIRKNLQDIVRGTRLQGQEDHCTTIRNLLIESFGTGSTVKSEFESRAIIKEKQVCYLKAHAEKIGLWLQSLPVGSQYLTRGGESEVYLAADKLNVIKVNDAIYYATWTEHINSLVIHNLLFPNTAYSFLGFMENKGSLCIVLQQSFIEGRQADINDIKELWLLLEDMHDENVVAKDDVLFFIDTVFYVMENK